MVKNYKSILKLLSFILYTNSLDYSIIDKELKNIDLENLSKNFIKLRELKAEIFQRPDLTFLRNMGDCDDFVTMTAYICQKKNINYKIGFKIKDNIVYHIFIKVENKIIDPWEAVQDGNELFFDLKNFVERLQV